jgi:hypothetical protein
MQEQGRLVEGLDLNRIAYSQVDGEFVVLQRWASHRIADANMAGELKANFLKSAACVAREPDREVLLNSLGGIHARLPGRDNAS